MKLKNIFFIIVIFSILPSILQAQISPFFSDEIINNIINEISGEKTLHNTIMFTPYERNRTADEYTGLFRESEYTLKMLKAYGYSEAHVEKWMLSAKEWDGEKAELWMVEPERKKICDYDELTASLAIGSQNADLTAELVDVGVGTSEKDYEGKDIKGKIILATGPATELHRIAILKKGAAGMVIYNDSPAAIDHPDQINWNPLRLVKKGEKAKSFAFKLTKRQGYELKQYLKQGKVTLHADIKVNYYPKKLEVPTAIIPGNGETDQEIIFLAHIFDQTPKQGANDNISGSAAILEIGRAIIKLQKENKIPSLRRSIRFLWIPEVTGTAAYFKKYPDEIAKLIGGVNMDMVGENLRLCNSIFRTRQTPHSLPSYINAVFRHTGELALSLETRLVAVSGTKDHFYYRFVPYESGTDQLVLNDSYLKIPTLFLGCWPDNFYHSSTDLPDKTDPTMLKRAVFIGLYGGLIIGCAVPDDVIKINSEVYALSKENISVEINRVTTMLNNAKPEDLPKTLYKGNFIINEAYSREVKAIHSSKVFSEGRDDINDYIDRTVENFRSDKKNTIRYIQNHYRYLCKLHRTAEKKYILGEEEEKLNKIIPVKIVSRDKILEDVFAKPSYKSFRPWSAEYEEVFNFVNGKRSVFDIANLMEAEFNKSYLEEVAKYIEILKEAEYIDYKY